VDLERREVIDLLPDRSAGTTAAWLKRHPEIEIISRDRCGSFAQGGREGAPQARQIADRFHLLQNLREAIQSNSAAPPVLHPAFIARYRGDAMISRSHEINMGLLSIAASPEWRTSVQGKRSLIGSERCGGKENP